MDILLCMWVVGISITLFGLTNLSRKMLNSVCGANIRERLEAVRNQVEILQSLARR